MTKIYVNLYTRAIGGCVGHAYDTRANADASAHTSRIGGCAHKMSDGNLNFLASDIRAKIEQTAKEVGHKPETVVGEILRAYLGMAA